MVEFQRLRLLLSFSLLTIFGGVFVLQTGAFTPSFPRIQKTFTKKKSLARQGVGFGGIHDKWLGTVEHEQVEEGKRVKG